MRRIIFLATLLLAVLVTSCSIEREKQTHKRVSKVCRTTDFERIVIESDCRVVYTQGDAPQVKLVGSQEALIEMEAVVRDGKLILRYKARKRFMGLKDSDNVTAYVTSPDLISVLVWGSGTFESRGRLDSDTLNICLHGSGEVKVTDIICDVADIELRGSGDVDIKQLQCSASRFALYGSGDVEANLYKVMKSEILVYGSGDVETTFNQCGKAYCKVAGSGDIELKGTLRTLEQTVAGSGDIDTKDLQVTGVRN